MKRIEKVFKALANKKRLEILVFIAQIKSASMGEIADEIKTSIKSTSKHLLVLYNADFLEKERVHGLTIYSLNDKISDTGKTLLNLLKKF